MVGADEVVVCDGKAARIAAVTVGQRSERGVEIVDGLKPGERVVIDHVLGLEDGQGLTAAPDARAGSAGAGAPGGAR
jgi:multidrug efflux pump subunit AcrA (membrane-fusion protein)